MLNVPGNGQASTPAKFKTLVLKINCFCCVLFGGSGLILVCLNFMFAIYRKKKPISKFICTHFKSSHLSSSFLSCYVLIPGVEHAIISSHNNQKIIGFKKK